MTKRDCNPFRQGMGTQDDFIAEPFVPSEHYKTQQMAIVQKLIAAGLNSEEVRSMLLVPLDLSPSEKPRDI